MTRVAARVRSAGRRLPMVAATLGACMAACAACSGAGSDAPAAAAASPPAASTPAAGVTGGGHGQIGPLVITGAYVPAPASPDVAAAYLTVRNTGDVPDQLIGVSTSAAQSAMLNQYVAGGDDDAMALLPALEIPAHGTATLVPGGDDLMLMNPRALQQGDHVVLQLTFARAGTINLTVPVVGPAGLAAGGTSGGNMPGMSG